jgi:hypothetical protein
VAKNKQPTVAAEIKADRAGTRARREQEREACEALVCALRQHHPERERSAPAAAIMKRRSR